jgi:hypothetical protein
MPRQPIKNASEGSFAVCSSMARATVLRYVQWDLSFKGSTKTHSRLDSLIRRDRECWDKLSAFIALL